MFQQKLIVLALLLISAMTACDFSAGDLGQVKTGPTETTNINVPPPSAGTVSNITLELGAASLELSGGATSLVQGTIQTNVAEWKPKVTTSGATVTIAQGRSESLLPDSLNTINKWNLKLGKTPINLTVRAGAYKGTINLGGVPLRSLKVEQGAATSEISFSSLNSEVLREFTVDTGASNIALKNLANANFEKLNFRGGASNYTLDFGGGKLQRSAAVSIKVGVSNLTLIAPEGTNAKVNVSGVRAVNPEDAWRKDGDSYSLAGSGYSLNVDAELGLGSLFLKNKP